MQLKNGKDLLIRKARKEDAYELIVYLNIVGGESDNLLCTKKWDFRKSECTPNTLK